MNVISNLSDLCQVFCADGPHQLNRRVYKGTNCGASISIHVGKITPVHDEYRFVFAQGEKTPILTSMMKNGKDCTFRQIHPEVRSCFHLRRNRGLVEVKIFPTLSRLLDASKKFMDNGKKFHRDGDTVIKEIEGSVIVVVHDHSKDKSRWLHNGDDFNIPMGTPLIGFTIQTIVEGSDVEINGDEFRVPVETEKVDSWVQDMEKQAEFYWKRDNLTHWRLTSPTGLEFFFNTGWGDPEWGSEEGEPPKNVKSRVISWINKNEAAITQHKEYRFGVKGWTVMQYEDNSDF